MKRSLQITHIRIKKQQLYLTVSLPSDAAKLQAELFCQDASHTYRHPLPCIYQNTQKMIFLINTNLLEHGENDWCLNLYSDTCPEPWLPILGGRLRIKLILGTYCIKQKDSVFFPMGSTGHRFILRSRPVKTYDRPLFRFKELAAFGLGKLLNPLWKKRHIWLIYEKYCISAQDNGFCFFQYCMENLSPEEKKNIFFILDKSSPQWSSACKYSSNIVPFLSFRHLLYLLTANLYVASDSRLHAFAWKPMPNLISREINKHDIYFLQHGVLALKRVEDLFGINGTSSMTYFTASSEIEKAIIEQDFGYKPEQIPITGLSRWDVLKDKSDPAHPSILVMPTWRSWLEDQGDESFRQSDYYKEYTSLLNDQKLREFLHQTHAELIFYIHPKLREYISSFHAEDPQIKLIPFGSISMKQLIMKCSMLITDYSSVSWDVYYLGKPVLFYQFDLRKYNETTGSYIDMETELFGERCMTRTDLLNKIFEYTENNFKEKPQYAKMRQKYFAYHDHNNRRRTYKFIKDQGY
ncbi:MAG: CDP-glycerol glycerophosphotransferase family protein [Eubacteriales bacterium]|nr:CDP-glycerol glycerophosphotransferase family protein [Eubacteriales bacterium]